MDWAWLHLNVNRLPVWLALAASLWLAFALARRSRAMLHAGLVLLLAGAAAVIPAYFSGAGAARISVYELSADDVVRHENWALFALAVMLAAGVAAIGALRLERRRKLPVWLPALCLLLALASVAAGWRAASLGTQLRHGVGELDEGPGHPVVGGPPDALD
ncbi:MAG: hypothetical protein KBD01_13100 [Acidobacteria bacterium]|nr:hypothetical protein [Acidobacteriota bacterium]